MPSPFFGVDGAGGGYTAVSAVAAVAVGRWRWVAALVCAVLGRLRAVRLMQVEVTGRQRGARWESRRCRAGGGSPRRRSDCGSKSAPGVSRSSSIWSASMRRDARSARRAARSVPSRQRPGQQQPPALTGRHRCGAADRASWTARRAVLEPRLRPHRCSAPRSSSSVASPRATRRLSRTVVANRCASSAKNTPTGGPRAGNSPAARMSRVVFPQPLGPTTATRAPGRNCRSGTSGRRLSSSPGSVSACRRRAAIRARVEGDGGTGQRGGRLERRQGHQHENRHGASGRRWWTARYRPAPRPAH